MANLDNLRAEVARACQVLGRLKLTHEPQGHVSARIPGTDRILIKGRGPAESPLSHVTPDDVITVDLNGRMVEGREGLVSANEVFIHTWMYRTRPDVNSVVHVHPPTIVLFTICDKPLLPLIGAYNPVALRILLEGVPTYPRAILINSDERGAELAAVMGQARICMMRGHGITAVGRSVREATLTAISLNDVAELTYRAYLLGDPRPISDEDLAEMRNVGGGGTRPGDRDSLFSNSEWRYYDELVGP